MSIRNFILMTKNSIMLGIAVIRALLQQATAYGSRSTALKPIGWMMPILVTATLGAFYINAPIWVGVMFIIFTSSTMILYLIAYIYFMFKDRDALRSETYSLRKMAIEKGMYGDDFYGLINPQEEILARRLLSPSRDKSKETE